jgi:tetratricopeptide (TPR) repeat protein
VQFRDGRDSLDEESEGFRKRFQKDLRERAGSPFPLPGPEDILIDCGSIDDGGVAILDQMDARQPDYNWWRLTRAVVVAVALGITLWNPWRPTPTFLYERGSALAPSDPSRARWMLRSAIAEAGGDFPDAQVQLCLLAIRSGDEDELHRLCRSLHWQDAEADALVSLGFTATSARRFESARQAYLELCNREPSYALYGLEGLANVYALEQRPEQALACLEEFTRRAPDGIG